MRTFLLACLLSFPLSALPQSSSETLLSSTETAYNPIPSPDGSMIAYVRTGKWEKGSGGLGRSNLGSYVNVMDTNGRILTDKPLAEAFLDGWTSDGRNLICYREHKYFLVSLSGGKSKEAEIPMDIKAMMQKAQSGQRPDLSALTDNSERGTYLPGAGAMVFAEHLYDPPRGTIRTTEKVIAQNDASHIGEMLVASPNGRYIAAVDVTGWADEHLWVYDTESKSWADLGKAIIHPADTGGSSAWEWMKCTWDPWFADSSHLAFISGKSIVISSPDGSSRQTITEAGEQVGLATPSPDGKLIAYIKSAAQENKEQRHWTFWGDTTIWVVPAVPGAAARPVTKQAPEATYCLRWLNAKEVVFDRLTPEQFGNNARLWKARVE